MFEKNRDVECFLKYIDTEGRENDNMSRCWKWTAYKAIKGYGKFRGEYAHRVSYQYFHPLSQPLKDTGLCVCHKCDNTSCCNPAHLFLGTIRDNNNDRQQKGRGSKGENHGTAVLTEQQVLSIIHQYKNENIRIHELAEQYKVSRTHIYRITRGLRWSYLQLNTPASVPSQTDTPHLN